MDLLISFMAGLFIFLSSLSLLIVGIWCYNYHTAVLPFKLYIPEENSSNIGDNGFPRRVPSLQDELIIEIKDKLLSKQ